MGDETVSTAHENTPGAPASGYAIELKGITKRFPGVVANDDVTLRVADGEIHAICGENGAGKSTLMKILYGMQAPDEGQMFVHGKEVQLHSPGDAIDLGIGMVHQHFMLADNLTVLENVILGSEPLGTDSSAPGWRGWFNRVAGGLGRGLGPIDFEAARLRFAVVAETYGLDVDPDTLVENLEVGERQRVEIIKVLYRGARILILDEPTAVLVPQEVEGLFKSMRELKAGGATLLFIDHKLEEVLEISDSITILRQGRTVTTVKPADVTSGDLAELMVGSELPSPETSESTVTDSVTLRVAGATVLDEDERPVVDDVSLEIRAGEILGVAGVEGNGQNELVEFIMGLASGTGSVTLRDQDITQWSVRRRRENGVGYVPQDRHREGLLLEAPLWENAALGHQTQEPYGRGLWIDRDGSRNQTEIIRSEFDVRTPDIDVPAHALSGGNQQKLIIGREMSANPDLLIAAHPTRGIDVGAQSAVWDDIRMARAQGLATLLISADLDELIGLSDTIVVMFRGRLVARLDPATVTPRDLGAYMTGAKVQDTSGTAVGETM